MATIANLQTLVTANVAGFESGMKKASLSLDGFMRHLTSFKALLLGALGAAGISATVSGLEDMAEEIDSTAKVADRLGFATESLLGLRHAAGLAGTDSASLDKALTKMSATLGQAIGGGGKAIKAFTDIGLSVQELANMSPDQQFQKIADAISAIESPAIKTAAAIAIFGKSGAELINTLSETSGGGLAAATEEMSALGLAFSRVDASSVEKANDDISRMAGVIRGAAQQFVIGLAPAISKNVAAFIEWAKQGGGIGRVFRELGNIAGALLQNVVRWTMSAIQFFKEWGTTIIGVTTGLVAFRGALMGLTLALKGVAAAKAVVLALSGPTGWAQLGAGLGFATAAIISVNTAFADIASSADSARYSTSSLFNSISAEVEVAEPAVFKIRKNITELIDKLREDVGNFGLSDTEKTLSNLKAMIREEGRAFVASPEDDPRFKAAQGLANELDALEKKKKVDEEIAEIERANAEFGLSATEKRIEALKRLTSDAEILNRAMRANAELEKKEADEKAAKKAAEEAKKRADDIEKRAKEMADAIATPLEEFNKRMKEIAELEGKLTPDQVARARMEALQKLDEATRGPEPKAIAALEKGTAAAFSAEREGGDAMLKTEKEILDQAKIHNTKLDEQTTAFKNNQAVPVTIGK